jgi:hypothetical protein
MSRSAAFWSEPCRTTDSTAPATAARLGISLRQIRYRIDRLGIDLPAEGSKHQSDNV